MADLNTLNANQTVKIAGSNSSGVATGFVNSDAQGGMVIAGEGTPGTPVGGVVSVQGESSGTPINTNITSSIPIQAEIVSSPIIDTVVTSTVNNTDVTATGTINGVNQTVQIATHGASTVVISITGNAAVNAYTEGSVDGVNWFRVNCSILGAAFFQVSSVIYGAGTYVSQVGGCAFFRIFVAIYASGSSSVILNAGSGTMPDFDRMLDYEGVAITSQNNGAQRALDVGIDVAGVQIDPRLSSIVKSTPLLASNGILLNPAALPNSAAISASIVEAHTLWGQKFGVAYTSPNITVTTEVPFLLINNPTGSGKSVKINKLELCGFLHGPSDFTTYEFYLNPTVSSNGVALVPVGARQTGQLSPVALWYSSPTITANGTDLRTILISSSPMTFIDNEGLGFWLDPGNSILVTAQITTSNFPLSVNISYIEE